MRTAFRIYISKRYVFLSLVNLNRTEILLKNHRTLKFNIRLEQLAAVLVIQLEKFASVFYFNDI